MRLLHVTHQYHPAIGGAEQYIVQLSEEMARRGHEVHVLTARSSDYETWHNVLPPRERINGVQVTRLWSVPRRGHTWRLLRVGIEGWMGSGRRRYEPLVWYGNGPVMPSLLPTALRLAPSFDLIHINQLHYAHAWPVALAARARKVPYLVTPNVHMEQPVTYTFPYMRTLLRKATALFAHTAAEASFIRDEALGRDVTVAGVGLELAAFPPRERSEARARLALPQAAPVLLFLGRKTEYKGIKALLDAFIALRVDYPELILLAVGPETEYSANLWRQVGALPGLIVHGAVPNDVRLDALAACDLLALPSTGESFGIVYLEAWAHARPVVGLRIGAVQSLIEDGVQGSLVEPEDQGALTDALRALVADPALRARMGAAGRRRLEQRYTTERIGDIVEGAYYRALRRHRTGKGS